MSESSAEAIDVHTHFVPSSIPAYSRVRSGVPWPSIDHSDCCAPRVMISGKAFRQIEDNCWNADRRFREMGPMGVTTQVLSPMPELLSYWMEPEDTASLARHVNAEIASVVRASGTRFRGLGMVALQAPQQAAEELAQVMALGLDGVEIGTNVNGRPIGDPSFEPFFAAAEAAGALVFVHPLRAAGRDQVVGPPGLEQIVAFPGETALAIASLMTGGILTRHPRLKLVFSHGGGGFAQVLPRLQHAWTLMPSIQDATGESPEVLARRLHFDSLVYSPHALKFLITQFGADRICIGTDYPFAILDRTPVVNVQSLGLDADATAAICYRNIRRLLAPQPTGS